VKENRPNLQSTIAYPLHPAPRRLPAGLYIHIPFCLSKCPYCGFYSVAKPELVDAFVKALTEEIRTVATQLPLSPSGERDGVKGKKSVPPKDTWIFDTIYIGGGTPSMVKDEHLGIILNQFNKFLILTSDIEITFEINPGDGGLDFFQRLFDLGINRLNLGVQSFDDRVLKFLGRRHSAAQARQAFEYARRSGFKNLGLDLIYGIPGQEVGSWMETLETAVTYSPEHLSCYELTIEENTPFASEVQKGIFALPGEETQREFFIRTSEFLEVRGYIHYEVSNFARGKEYLSRHNQKYWDHTPYLGFGPAAHSFTGARRWWNHRSVEKYIESVEKGALPIESFEDLTLEQRMLEKIYFGMRTRKGIDLNRFRKEFRVDWEVEKGKTLSLLKQEGLITIQKGVLSPTCAGLAVADRLALI